MMDYIKPTINQNPTEVIIHCGTNDLKSKEPRTVAEGIVDLARYITSSSDSKVIISELVCRREKDLNSKVNSTNKLLRKFSNQNGWGVISHNNIEVSNLNRGGVHLLPVGNVLMHSNFVNFVNYSKSNN
jgi:hypothetical protein